MKDKRIWLMALLFLIFLLLLLNASKFLMFLTQPKARVIIHFLAEDDGRHEFDDQRVAVYKAYIPWVVVFYRLLLAFFILLGVFFFFLLSKLRIAVLIGTLLFVIVWFWDPLEYYHFYFWPILPSSLFNGNIDNFLLSNCISFFLLSGMLFGWMLRYNKSKRPATILQRCPKG